MKRDILLFAGVLITSIAATGCRNGQVEVSPSVTQVQPVYPPAPEATKPTLQTDAIDKNDAAVSEAVKFLNSHFVVANAGESTMETSSFHVTDSTLSIDFDISDPGRPKRHFVDTAKVLDLDPATISDNGVGYISVKCKAASRCESESCNGQTKYHGDEFIVGPFSSVDVDEAKQYFTRLLFRSSGNATSLPEVVHSHSESEIISYLQRSIPASGQLGTSGLNFYDRTFSIDGDVLRVAERLVDTNTGRPGFYVVTISISQLQTAFASEGNVSVHCDLAPQSTNLAHCITDNIGHQMSQAVIVDDVSNAKEVVAMLNELIRIHRPNFYSTVPAQYQGR